MLRFVVASTYHTRTTYMWQTIQRKALLPAQGTVVKTAKCSARPQTPCRNSTKVEQCSITTAYTVGKLFLIANASSHRMLSSRLPDYYAGTNDKKIRIIVLIKQIKTDNKKTTLSAIMHKHNLLSTIIIASWSRGNQASTRHFPAVYGTSQREKPQYLT